MNYYIRQRAFYYILFWYGHIKNNQFFDLDVYEIGKVIPKYVDEYDNEKEVESIQEAIKKYDLLQTHVIHECLMNA